MCSARFVASRPRRCSIPTASVFVVLSALVRTHSTDCVHMLQCQHELTKSIIGQLCDLERRCLSWYKAAATAYFNQLATQLHASSTVEDQQPILEEALTSIKHDVLLNPPESGLPGVFQPFENAVVQASGQVAQLATAQVTTEDGGTVEMVVLD
eukprot:TRINITY_DN10717_c0_g1_i1.p2 TRINITY_DN10717_c0_g1~~TRINITY_DN10717_c0_g1_i1.p2  ORF type:complete len:154 (+),score=30.14 TRINITY_DN10717_c0_g1_i1:1968-2429(+)